MKSILEELWYGNICPETDGRTTTPENEAINGIYGATPRKHSNNH